MNNTVARCTVHRGVYAALNFTEFLPEVREFIKDTFLARVFVRIYSSTVALSMD